MFASLILWVEEDVVRKCGHCKLEQDICHYSIFSYCMLEMFVIIVSFSFQLLIIYRHRHYIGYRCLYKSLSYYIIHVSFLDVLQFLFGFNTFPWTGSKASHPPASHRTVIQDPKSCWTHSWPGVPSGRSVRRADRWSHPAFGTIIWVVKLQRFFIFAPKILRKWSNLTSIFFNWVGSTTWRIVPAICKGVPQPQEWGTYDHHGYEPLINWDDPPSITPFIHGRS